MEKYYTMVSMCMSGDTIICSLLGKFNVKQYSFNKFHFFLDLGCNHVHLTVRLGFVTQHLCLGDFGKCNRVLCARILRLRYTKSLGTFPLS